MIKPEEVATDCSMTDVAGKADHELYLINPRRIAASKAELKNYAEKYMCRRHMVLVAAKHSLSLDDDFETREQVQQEAQFEKNRLAAFGKFLDWVEAYDILPDVMGKAPKLGRQYLCRKCGEPFSNEQLFVFDKRFIANLHPDLGENSARPRAQLAKRSFCRPHFDEIRNGIGEAEDTKGIVRTRIEEGSAFSTLAKVFESAKR